MSDNSQTLIKKHNGKYYVFTNVMAESWGWDEEKDVPAENELLLSSAVAECDTLEEAYSKAHQLDDDSEYGVQVEYLQKDGSEVKLI